MAATEGRARSYVFSPLASRLQLARERRRELRVDEKAQSSAPQDGVVVLPGGELQHCGDVLGFEIWVIRENLLARGTGRKEVEHILHTMGRPRMQGRPPQTSGLTVMRSSALIHAL